MMHDAPLYNQLTLFGLFFLSQTVKYIAINFHSKKIIAVLPPIGFQIYKCNYKYNVVQFLAQRVSIPFP